MGSERWEGSAAAKFVIKGGKFHAEEAGKSRLAVNTGIGLNQRSTLAQMIIWEARSQGEVHWVLTLLGYPSTVTSKGGKLIVL